MNFVYIHIKKNIYDNNDKRIPYYSLLLERDLTDIPRYELPVGFHFAFYEKGDRDAWIEIEKSAKEFDAFEQGIDAWSRYYADREPELCQRMVFVETDNGEKIATATAFYDVKGVDTSGSAWLHWVAVKREYQGRELSKPLISHVLGIMQKLGYSHVKIPTQTNTWLAVKIYLDFGFLPVPENVKNSYDGWCIIKSLTEHISLAEFQ